MKNKILTGFVLICTLILVGLGSISYPSAGIISGPSHVVLGLENTVTIRGVIDSVSSTKAMLQLAELSTKRGNKDYPLYLVLDTPGGSIDDGLNFIEFAKTIKNLKTISIFAASMGSAIVQGLPGERLVPSNGILMFHRAYGGFEGQFNDGELESQLNFWKSIVTSMEQTNADRMGMKLEVYKEKIKDELWIYGKNNLTHGSADRLVSLSCTDQLRKETDIMTFNFLFFTVDKQYSKCPLLRDALKIIPHNEEE